MLRVAADANGYLEAVPPQARGMRAPDECWWQAVLNDWHVRPRQPRYHFDTLGECASATVVIACAECHLRKELRTAELLPIYGQSYRMVYLRYDLACCPKGKSLRDCSVRYPRER